jgi:hypothetical protein
MSLLIKGGGITKLSQLIMDAANAILPMATHKITSVSPGVISTDAARVDQVPSWAAIQDFCIFLTGAVNRAIVVPPLSIPVPTVGVVVAEDHSGGGQAVSKSLSVPTPSIAVATALATISAVGGGVAHMQTGPLDADETAQTNSAAVNDMDLLPAAGNASGDGFYFGFASLWDALCLIVGTAGAGTYTIAWKYWNGANWATALTIIFDETNHFKSVGTFHLNFQRPVDWAVTTVAGIANLYWIKAEVTMGTMTVQPKGTQAFILNY